MSNGHSQEGSNSNMATAVKWKWIAGVLVSLVVSNVTTAFAFRTTPSQIKAVMEDSFTDVSDGRGMYAKEGRRRLETLELAIKAMVEGQAERREAFARIEAQLKRLSEDVRELRKK